MNAKKILATLRQSLVMVISVGLVGLAMGIAVALFAPPTYTATTSVYVSAQAQTNDSPTSAYEGGLLSQQRVTSYVQLVTSPRVAQQVVQQLQLPWTAEEFTRRVSARATTGSVLIEISADDASPELSAAIANATTTNFTNLVAELEAPIGGGPPQIVARVVQRADVPVERSSPSSLVIVAAGLAAGLVFGALFAVARRALDTSLRSTETLSETAQAPSLGAIPRSKLFEGDKVLFADNSMSPPAEAYRQVRTSLRYLTLADANPIYLITSPLPSEGKSTTASNLGAAAAESGLRTLIIEADLRRPRVSSLFGVEGSVGLTSVLTRMISLADAVQSTGMSRLSVLASGQLPPNPSELLGSGQMSELLDEARRMFDLVLIDGPPLLPVTDAAVLAPSADAVVLVAKYSATRVRSVEESRAILERVGVRLSGVVLTHVPSSRGSEYGQYYGYGYSQVAAGIDAGRGGTSVRKEAGREGASVSQAVQEASTEQMSRRPRPGPASRPR